MKRANGRKEKGGAGRHRWKGPVRKGPAQRRGILAGMERYKREEGGGGWERGRRWSMHIAELGDRHSAANRHTTSTMDSPPALVFTVAHELCATMAGHGQWGSESVSSREQVARGRESV